MQNENEREVYEIQSKVRNTRSSLTKASHVVPFLPEKYCSPKAVVGARSLVSSEDELVAGAVFLPSIRELYFFLHVTTH